MKVDLAHCSMHLWVYIAAWLKNIVMLPEKDWKIPNTKQMYTLYMYMYNVYVRMCICVDSCAT